MQYFVSIENTGNTDLTFNITSTNSSIIYADTDNLEIPKEGTENILLSYNATSINPGIENLVNITLTLQTDDGNPPSTTIPINLTTVDYSVTILSPSTENKLSNLTYNDTITINATAKIGDTNITENITWVPTITNGIESQVCLNIDSNYSTIRWNPTKIWST